jgi:hypothetical protein
MPIAVAVVVGFMTADLALGGATARANRMLTDPIDGIERLTEVDLTTYYRQTGASSFLEQRVAQTPSRFFGFAPDIDGRQLAYTFRFAHRDTVSLLVNNQAVSLHLQDIQGYDASHLRRYDAFLAALNGRVQDYHDATIFATGLSSPLLDLLNARYVLVPAHLEAIDDGLARFSTPVYEDTEVKILENVNALPRAWIVHAAEQFAPGGGESLLAIASGRVDARRTALLEEPPPVVDPPSDASYDQARVVRYEANEIEIHTFTTAAGILVLSEIAYPAWRAYVDNQPERLYVADGALRAVPVPVGEHTVELRFESETLRVGVLMSCTALLLLVLIIGACATRWLRTSSSGGDHE